jgi:hypothetical protein
MNILSTIFGSPPYPKEHKREVQDLLDELARIGKTDDFLSERPGAGFNGQCRNIRAREIGKRLDEVGGYPLMEMAYKQIRKKLGQNLASHLEYAWAEIGGWLV